MPYLGREISGEYLALGSFVVERANISVGPGVRDKYVAIYTEIAGIIFMSMFIGGKCIYT